MDAEFYEKYGQLWSNTQRRELERLDASFKVKNLCELLGDIKPKTILDYGCDLGDATMVAAARREHPSYTFIHGGLEQLENRKVDLITFFDVLEHLADIPAALNAAKRTATYIAIKIPLEKTWLIALLNRLRLKQPRSRAFESEGHLYEFNQREVEAILDGMRLKIIKAECRFAVEEEFLFSELVSARMKNKHGVLPKFNCMCHQLLKQVPYSLTTFFLRPYIGDDFYVVCRGSE